MRNTIAAIGAATIVATASLSAPAHATESVFTCPAPGSGYVVTLVNWVDYGDSIVVYHRRWNMPSNFYRFYDGWLKEGGHVVKQHGWTSYADPTVVTKDVTLTGDGPRWWRFEATFENQQGAIRRCVEVHQIGW